MTKTLTKQKFKQLSIVALISTFIFYAVNIYIYMLPTSREAKFGNFILSLLWCLFVGFCYFFVIVKEIDILWLYYKKHRDKSVFTYLSIITAFVIIIAIVFAIL